MAELKINRNGNSGKAGNETVKAKGPQKPRRTLGKAAQALPVKQARPAKARDTVQSRIEQLAELDRKGYLLSANVDYLKKEFGIDLKDVRAYSSDDVRNIAFGGIVDNKSFTVQPVAGGVEYPEISNIASFRVLFPRKKDADGRYVQVPAGKEARITLDSYPYHPYVEKGDVGDTAVRTRVEAGKYQKPSKAQVQALRGVGVDLYTPGILSPEEQKSLLEGLPVNMSGSVRTADGVSVNICGVVQIQGEGDNVVASFRPNSPFERSESVCMDLERGHSVGSVSMLVEREGSKKVSNGNVVLFFYGTDGTRNQSGKDIQDCHMTLGPVSGMMYGIAKGADGSFERTQESVRGIAYEINGGIRFEPFDKSVSKDKLGNDVTSFSPRLMEGKDGSFSVEFKSGKQKFHDSSIGRELFRKQGIGMLADGTWVAASGNGKVAAVNKKAQKYLEAMHPYRKQSFKPKR